MDGADGSPVEALTPERLDSIAVALAEAHRDRPAPAKHAEHILDRLEANRKQLTANYRATVLAAESGGWISPAGEWLLDNFHVISEQLREARENLPLVFYRELPVVATSDGSPEPRAFAIAAELIACTDGQLDVTRLERFLTAYQTITELTIGELWAVPIALRHGFLDRLAQIAARVDVARREREAASALADELAQIAEKQSNVGEGLRHRVSRRTLPSTTMFATELAFRLRDRHPDLALANEWLEQRIHAQGTTLEEAIRSEHRSQGANQVTVGNCITSMRTITATNWNEVVESLSVVERVLRMDPSGVYAKMEFSTRDRYRHVIERLGKHSPLAESTIASRAIVLAASHSDGDERRRHVGYYLIDRGVATLEEATRYRSPILERVRGTADAHAIGLYLGAIIGTSVVLTPLFAWLAHALGASSTNAALLACTVLLPLSELAVALTNLVVTSTRAPRALPKLDFSDGIPAEHHCLVVVPMMLSRVESVADAAEALELRFLANQDPALQFALLSDFTDASTRETPNDALVLDTATQAMRRLNQRYGERFHLFCRERVWSDSERVFMGWERKRGKLDELNRFLLGEPNALRHVVGEPSALEATPYVITLDADTQLPLGTAARLVATAAHPLNRPRVDEHTRLVIEGHAVLQPRVSTSPSSAGQNALTRIYAYQEGIDPYTSAVSDVYQDLFDEGSYVGKGIYDVRAFHESLRGAVPEASVLSHDLLEGSFARAGLVSDVELYDDTPSHYLVETMRRHRWTRGDWQIASWLTRSPREGATHVVLPVLARWKIFDNLRRTLVGPFMLCALLLGWALLAMPALWTLAIVSLLTLPIVAHASAALLRPPRHASYGTHLQRVSLDVGKNLLRALLSVLFLPFEASTQTDAIVRALYRRYVSHRHLLQWMTAAQAEQNAEHGVAAFYRTMGIATAIVFALIVGLALCRGVPYEALPFLIGWLAAPWVASHLSADDEARDYKVGAVARYFLRRTALKTWQFFATFVNEEDNHLPPDNYQEEPTPLIAHRTSPTNLGLALLANLTAVDLGYLGIHDCIARIEKALASMTKLELHRGHFLNWYDTRTRAALLPRYVSTVDSGNLAAMLVALQHGCLGMVDHLASPGIRDGIVDVLRLLDETLAEPGAKPLSKLREKVSRLERTLDHVPEVGNERAAWLQQLAENARTFRSEVRVLAGNTKEARAVARWSDVLVTQVESHLRDSTVSPSEIAAATERLVAIAANADAMVEEMDFHFLYHRQRQVFSIGYDVLSDRLDNSYYDLLASEARITSFLAIAKGDVPVRHWYKLGRPLTNVGSRRALMSWSGTMFEYLMPNLLLRSHRNTLLDETARAIVSRQIAYGKERKVPWGISESAYNARDLQLNYQYGPFGVPGLGLKRGLADDLVVAPYATALALTVDAKAAVDNLWRLVAEGLDGDLGFCESIDYTASRVPRGQRGAVVRCFMAHHQGMSLLAIAEYLLDRPMSNRFHADPRVKSTELLLRERIPYDAPLEGSPRDGSRKLRPAHLVSHEMWKPFDGNADPEVSLLSNGNYAVMVSAAGGGYSHRGDLAVTRWKEDPTRDAAGAFLYLRDRSTPAPSTGPAYWSATHQPVKKPADESLVSFSVDRAEWKRVDGDIATHLALSVSTEDDAEIRLVTVANHGSEVREIELTSYLEVVLTTAQADEAHPAFAKLFVETERAAGPSGLLASRRPRSPEDARPWAVHVCAVDGETVGDEEFETSREQFLGRGRTTASPQAMDRRLTGTVGTAVLDPIFSLRRCVRIKPGKSARVSFATAMADTKEAAQRLVEKYSSVHAAERASALAWTQAQSQLHYLDITTDDTRLFLRVAAKLLYSNRSLRAHDGIVASNRRGQSSLWAYGISGDLPIVLVRVDGDEQIGLVREVLHAHEYWRMRGLTVDVVILNEHPPSYLQELSTSLLSMIRSSPSAGWLDKRGGIFVRSADHVSAEDRVLLSAVARVQLLGTRGDLAAQVDARRAPPKLPDAFAVRSLRKLPTTARPSAEALAFDNGIGGFSLDGKEYVVRLSAGTQTPAPWSNVLANPSFGCVVSESGAGYEWADNSHENRLTEWMNDPVSDPVTSALYLRDEHTGNVWSPTPQPVRTSASYEVRHGQGYTRFAVTDDGIASELTLFVGRHDPVKLSRLRLRNTSDAPRRLTVWAYVEWTLGVLRPTSAPHVVTRLDEESGALFARNTYPNDLGSRIAFLDLVPKARTFTGDRTEFLGRHGDTSDPAALKRVGLSNRVGAGYDPCAAMQIEITLLPGESKEVVTLLGQVGDEAHARTLLQKYHQVDATQTELDAVIRRWDELLGAIQLETPDPALDFLMNRWLLYQAMSARLWARTGLYQSGGAYGFRDQLQDVAALVYGEPRLAREHILRASAHQFPDGDVLHWWHPPADRGVRTRFADDYLWLPFIVAHYLKTTGDVALLDEETGFVEARQLAPDEHEAYLSPTRSEMRASIYDHCLRALDRSLVVGVHGLPLMGCGDWNDGMNRVGIGGKGESVWMGWFLITVLERFAPICKARGDQERVTKYAEHVADLKRSIEDNAWDGEWYLRAFFDDGTPLGSSKSDECQIDALSQSWSVISGAGNKERSIRALAAVSERLVDREHKLIKLLTPPFDHTPHDPGYIKGYVPGVRENGGQYTHAAVWTMLAEAMLGHGDAAGSLLNMLNPVHRSSDVEGRERYRVEPYVVAADVWSLEPHEGRGGWTWYTGSASWLYRAVLESIVGLEVGERWFSISPCIPSAWPHLTLRYQRGRTRYRIVVKNPDGVQRGVTRLTVDGHGIEVGPITFVDDGAAHEIEVTMGAASG